MTSHNSSGTTVPLFFTHTLHLYKSDYNHIQYMCYHLYYIVFMWFDHLSSEGGLCLGALQYGSGSQTGRFLVLSTWLVLLQCLPHQKPSKTVARCLQRLQTTLSSQARECYDGMLLPFKRSLEKTPVEHLKIKLQWFYDVSSTSLCLQQHTCALQWTPQCQPHGTSPEPELLAQARKAISNIDNDI